MKIALGSMVYLIAVANGYLGGERHAGLEDLWLATNKTEQREKMLKGQ